MNEEEVLQKSDELTWEAKILLEKTVFKLRRLPQGCKPAWAARAASEMALKVMDLDNDRLILLAEFLEDL